MKWTIADLAEQSGVGSRTIKRVEAFEGYPQSSVATLERLRSAFELQGIEFIGSPEDGPGIRLWRKPETD